MRLKPLTSKPDSPNLLLTRHAFALPCRGSVLFVMPIFKDCRAQEASLCQIDLGDAYGPPVARPCAAPSKTAVVVTGGVLLCLVCCACVGVLLAYRTLCAARRTKARKRARARKKREAAAVVASGVYANVSWEGSWVWRRRMQQALRPLSAR